MKEIMDEYGTLIISAIAAIIIIGLIAALFFGQGNNIISEYLNNSI